MHAALVAMAGTDFTWLATSGTHRLTSDARVGLAAWLTDAQGSTCAFCGDSLGGKPELCHIVSGGEMRKGFLAPNIAMGCRDCNEIDSKAWKVIGYESIARADLVQIEWPDTPYLASLGRDLKIQNEDRKNKKREIRGM